jgi:hypothetical protein
MSRVARGGWGARDGMGAWDVPAAGTGIPGQARRRGSVMRFP